MAQDIETYDGYAACTYAGFYKQYPNDIEGISEDDRTGYFYVLYTYAYKDKGRRVWGELYESDLITYGAVKNDFVPMVKKTDITNYSDIFDASKVFDKFYDNGSYQCPSAIYVSTNHVYLDKCDHNQEVIKRNDVCREIKLTTNSSSVSNEKGTLSIKDAQPGELKKLSYESHKEAIDNGTTDISVSTDVEKIIDWANKLLNEGNGDNPTSGKSGCSLISGKIQDLLRNLFFYLSIAGFVIVVAMSIFDLIKAITGDVDDAMKKFLKSIKARLVSLVVLLLLPMLVTFVTNTVNNVAKISGYNANNPLCGVIKTSSTSNNNTKSE